jgi:hypothetical protein
LCCACSSRAFEPRPQLVDISRSSSAAGITQKSSLYVLVEAPMDPRVPDRAGTLVYPDEASARIHGLWLREGIREDQRMQDFIVFSGAYEYSWWDGGGGLTLRLRGTLDLPRLALRWGKFFPDVVRDFQAAGGSAARQASRDLLAPACLDTAPDYCSTSGYYSGPGYYDGSGYTYPGGYGAYCRGCNLPRLNCSCPGNCCGARIEPKPRGGIENASGPFVRK